MIDKLLKVADELDKSGLHLEADEVMEGIEEVLVATAAAKKTKEKSKGKFVFPASHPKVKDDKDHFPINTKGRGQNALARANAFTKPPTWFSGTVKEFLSAVVKAVKKEYPGIAISEKGKKPGKG